MQNSARAIGLALIILWSETARPCTNRLIHVYFDGCAPIASTIRTALIPDVPHAKAIVFTLNKPKAGREYWRATWGAAQENVRSGDTVQIQLDAYDVRTSCMVTADPNDERDDSDCAVVFRVPCEPTWKVNLVSESKEPYDFWYKLEAISPASQLATCGGEGEQETHTDVVLDAGEGQNIFIRFHELSFLVTRMTLLKRPNRTAPLHDFVVKSGKNEPKVKLVLQQ